MPRTFTKIEKERIRKDLIRAMSELIVEKGIRKTNIDYLVKASHISKGAFYLFYDSKEMLIFEAIRSAQDDARSYFLNEINNAKGNSAAKLKKILLSIFNIFETNPLLKVISQSEEMYWLKRSLPDKVKLEEYESDEIFFNSVFKDLIKKKIISVKDVNMLTGIPRIILALIMNKNMIGKERFDKLINVLISGLSNELS